MHKFIKRCYAKPNNADSRYAILKKMLYDPSIKEYNPQNHLPQQKRIKKHEPLVAFEQGEAQEKDLIERQWALFKLKEKHEFIERKKLFYKSMREAMTALEQHERLFKGAIEQKDIELFSTQLKIAGDTPAIDGWDYEMDRNK